MTLQPITNGTEPGRANNPPGLVHAYVENGDLFIMMGGRFRKAEGWDAAHALLALEGSPFPSSQERARQIRAALKETMQ